MTLLLALPAPAKLNLFLRVTGRRTDGYHTLRSAMQLVSLADWIDLERRDDGQLLREGDLTGPVQDDLALRAAQALQRASGSAFGATIRVRKSIPTGSGLGGGSSDAATTLIGLNRLWRLQLSRDALAAIGLALGADVPFFVHGRNALAQGVGEQLTPLALPPAHYLIVWPQVHVSTREIFEGLGLTVPVKATKMAGFPARDEANSSQHRLAVSDEVAGDRGGSGDSGNDLQQTAQRKAPVIAEAIECLRRFGDARMTGSGAAVFVQMASTTAVEAAAATLNLPPGWGCWTVRGLDEHPLLPW